MSSTTSKPVNTHSAYKRSLTIAKKHLAAKYGIEQKKRKPNAWAQFIATKKLTPQQMKLQIDSLRKEYKTIQLNSKQQDPLQRFQTPLTETDSSLSTNNQ